MSLFLLVYCSESSVLHDPAQGFSAKDRTAPGGKCKMKKLAPAASKRT